MATVLAAVVAMGAVPAAAQDVSIVRFDKVSSGAYAVVAEVRAKKGKESELRNATLPLVAAARHEPNNLLYFLHEDPGAVTPP